MANLERKIRREAGRDKKKNREKVPAAEEKKKETETPDAASANDKKISRRTLLLGAIGASVPMSEVAVGQLHSLQGKETELTPAILLERRKSFKNFESPNAKYQIEYTVHNKFSSPEILKGADALVLEYAEPWGSEESAVQHVAAMLTGKEGATWPYPYVLAVALESGKPIFLVDLSTKELNDKAEFEMKVNMREFFRTGEIYAGTFLAHNALKGNAPAEHAAKKTNSKDESGKTDRRDFLGRIGKGVAAAYLLSHVPEMVGGQLGYKWRFSTPDEGSLLRAVERYSRDINDVIHPETRTLVIQGRNDLIAQKSEAVAQMLQKELGRKPTIALEIGGEHTSIETSFSKSQDQRVQYLKRVAGPHLKAESVIAKIVLEGQGDDRQLKATMLRDPALSD